jgi:hypothetical protein
LSKTSFAKQGLNPYEFTVCIIFKTPRLKIFIRGVLNII